ncbi:MAG: ADOP family duplicated permease [Gemmatimonadales bacterium]
MKPPHLAERWLASVIPDPHARDGVLGDMRERYAQVARRFTAVGAHLWYWFAAAATVRWYVLDRRRGQRRGRAPGGRGEPSIVRMTMTIGYEARLAFRAVRRTPGFAAVAIATIGLGIGASTAIFSVLDDVVLKPLPYGDADRVVRITHTAPGRGIDRLGATDGMYFHYRENAATLEDFALYIEQSVPADGEEEPIEAGIIIATPSLFSILQVSPFLGRLFTEEDAEPGVEDRAVLTHRFWMREYGGDSTIIGQSLSETTTIPIIGVLPEWFDFIRPEAQHTFGNSFDKPDIFIPLTLRRARARFGNFMYQAVGRLAPGATLETATNELTVLMHQMPELYPENGLTARMVEEGRHAPVVERFKDAMVGDVAKVLWIIMGAVGFVLLIAMVNVLNLFIVRAESRRREIAVRRALGASRGKLLRAFLSEGLLLAAGGGGLGILLAVVGTGGLLRLAPAEIPRLDQVGVDGRVLVFAGAISMVVALVLGALPALRYTKLNLAAVVGDQSRGATTSRARHRTRHALVVTQVAFAFVLLVGSGLLIRTFWNLRNVRPGFGGTNALIVRVTLPGTLDGPQGRTDFMLGLTERLEGVPGISSAAYAADLPLDGVGWSAEIALEESIPEPGNQAPAAGRNFVGPGYLASIGATLLRGRELERSDYATDPDVAVVNRSFADERWPGENPIGKRLVQWPAEEGAWYRVVGVTADIHEVSLAEAPEPMVYLPTVFRPGTTHGMFATNFAIVMRTSGDPLAVLSAVRQVIANSGSVVPITSVQTLEGLKAASMRQLSFAMVLLVTAGSAALLLSIVGIYGVVAYVVGQRPREIGVRIALGARPADVRRMVLRQSARVGTVGVAVGLAGAVVMSRVLQSLLFGVASTDLLTYGGVVVLLLVLVLTASFLPARRAAAVDPVNALRAE